MNRKLLCMLLVFALAASMAGVVAEAAPNVSIDFEDGLFGFVGMDMTAGNADASELSIVDYNGSKALKITVAKKVPYLAFELEGLLGENIANVRQITLDIGVDLGDGKFYACSGSVYAYSGEENVKTKDDWAVYLKNKNPKTAVAPLAEEEYFVTGAGNYIVFTKEVDNYATKTGNTPLAMYIDNICFLDENGIALPVDTSAMFVARSSGPDFSNLVKVDKEIEIGGAGAGGAWSQGADMLTVANDGTFDPAVLTEDSIITIYFEGTGNMWLVGVSSGNPNGDWIRIADGGNAPINGSHNMAQVTYAQIVAALGENFAETLHRFQCESDSEWKVTKVTAGVPADLLYGVINTVDLGVSAKGGAWSQGADIYTVAAGGTFDPAAIVPGTVFNVNYAGEGDMWLVGISDGNPNGGWIRIANDGASLNYGGNAQITYDQIVAALGEDFASTLQRIQCESDREWEVYAVTFGTAVGPYVEAKAQEDLGGAGKAGAWTQGADVYTVAAGGTFDPAALTPESVITVNYSGAGNMWLVGISGGNPNGDWIRIADGGRAAKNEAGDKVQITYDQIVSALGADFASTLQRIQCESDQEWEVYSVTLGVSAK